MNNRDIKKHSILRRRLAEAYHSLLRQYYTKFGLDRDLYLVYTMSKVGSSSVYNSLKKKYPYKEIYHIHFLGDTWLDSFKTGHPIFNNNLKHADALVKLLHKKRWNIKIITLTREPIARDISGIFQTWQHLFDVQDVTEVTPEAIVNYLRTQDFTFAQNWFETDFLEFTGLDVLKQSFNASKGFQIYTSTKAPILIIQLEQLNNVYNQAMNAFLGKGSYKLQEENLTVTRESGELNSAVKRLTKFPSKRLDDLYKSQYVTTFYNKTQIDKFKDRWVEK